MTIIPNFIRDGLVRHLLGIEALPMPTNLKLALYTTDAGILTDTPEGEVVDTNYVRHALAFDENDVSLPFHFEGLATQQTITHHAIVGDIGGETRIIIAESLTNPSTLSPGQIVWYDAGKVDISFTV